MRVLFVSNSVHVGGVETNLVLLAREFAARGHGVTVASGGGDLVEALGAAGARHVTVPIGLRSPAQGVGGPAQVVRSARRLAGLVAADGADVVHVFSAASAALILLASWLARARGAPWPPVVSSVMGLQEAADESAAKTYLRCYATTLGAARTLVISPEIGRVVRRLPVSPARVRECRVVGVDDRLAERATPARTAALRAALGLAPDARVVLTIGNLAHRKSHELFIRAAAALAPRFPAARFLIVGEGALRPQLAAEIAHRGLGDRVRLLGQRTDVAELLGLAEVYVKPGVVEGFVGITVLEAQMVGRPVVAFDTVDVRLAITDGETGLIAERGSPARLADAVARLLGDDALARRLAAAAQTSVRARFSIGAIVTGLEQQYAELIAAHDAA